MLCTIFRNCFDRQHVNINVNVGVLSLTDMFPVAAAEFRIENLGTDCLEIVDDHGP